MSNPYLIEGPALISFSGGRTSAYMLYQIIQAHGGKLPDDVIVSFANTGKEREETLRFVHECGSRWGVKIHWVEWRPDNKESKYAAFEEVGFNSASRRGEPFKALIDLKRRLPNTFQRWCTTFLKIYAKDAIVRDKLGLEPGEYLEVIGLRNDEGGRILKGFANADVGKRKVRYPLAKAKVVKADILRFWLGENTDPKDLKHPLPQGFDLGLRDYEGNCDLCFQKGKGIRKRIIRDAPHLSPWWHEQEFNHDGWFDSRDRVIQLVEQVRRSPTLFDETDDMEYDVECGLHCATEDAA
ncbi:hypothetical protein A6R70_14525 [Agrobacterium rubi]|uniref:Nin-like protein n=1 Tax=Agrobacterium rubi TaxID=28099 RepID=UPI00201B813E|nr:Nin-like protein [Agrobacterium rubi]MCL6653505.1 hypothetical protein [Agrobacterium rubi]